MNRIKSFCTILLASLFISGNLSAQSIHKADSLSITVRTRTLTGSQKSGKEVEVGIRLNIHDMPSGTTLNDQYSPDFEPLRFRFKYEQGAKPFENDRKPTFTYGQRFIQIKYPIRTKRDVEWIYENTGLITLSATGDIKLLLSNSDTLAVDKAAINNLDFKNVSLTTAEKEDLIDALGGYKSFYYDRFDAGWRDAESDSGNAEGYFDFAKAFDLGSGFMVELEGLLSTDMDDIASYLQVSPIYFRTDDNKFHINAAYQGSLNGDEQRLMGRLSYRSILKQNPVNLTRGFDRLRLKPYLNVGVTVMYFTESANPLQKEEYFFEPFASALYIIPISEKYTARLDAFAYWRSDAGTFDFISENIDWQGTVQLGYGIGNSAQIIGKYSYGTFNLTNETNNRLMVGFLMELLNK